MALEVVGLSGLEPLTSRLSGGRSNQLSYRPRKKADSASRAPMWTGRDVGRTTERKKKWVALVTGASIPMLRQPTDVDRLT
jgi:hypothetical protein